MQINVDIVKERIAELEASANKIAGALNEARLFLQYLESPEAVEPKGTAPVEVKKTNARRGKG